MDAFSNAKFEDARDVADRSDAIYAISLVIEMQRAADLHGPPPLKHFNWGS